MKTILAVLLTTAISISNAQAESIIATKALRFNALGQFWTLGDSTHPTAKSQLRIRRAELKFSGDLTEQFSWVIQIDPSKNLTSGLVSSSNDNKALQDFILTFKPSEDLQLAFGQMKIPTTFEGTVSASKLFFPERSLTARTFGDKRQIGIQSKYGSPLVSGTVMITNGGTSNTEDTTSEKDLIFRVDSQPIDQFSFGAFLHAPDLQFGINRIWGIHARSKLSQFQVNAQMATQNSTIGLATDIAYALTESLLPALRWDWMTDTTSVTSNGWAATAGVTWFAGDGILARGTYSYLYRLTGGSGTYRTAFTGTTTPGHMLILALEASI